jgi:transposase
MRIVGLDIHRVFAEAVMLDEGKVVRLGRVGMTREHLDAFARAVLTHDDPVVVEATGNATAVAEVLAPHVGRVVIANPRQVRLIAEARIKTDVIDATVLARLYASGFLPEVWVPDARTEALRRQVTRRMQIVRQRARLKTMIQSILHAHRVPPCPHADLLGPKGRAWLLEQPLPPDEADAVARHLREHDRLSEDLRVVEREIARDALANPDAKRLMTIPGRCQAADDDPRHRHGGGRRPARRDRARHAVRRAGQAGLLPRPEPDGAPVGRGPAPAWPDQQARPHPCPDDAGRGRLAGGARPRTAARVPRAGRPAARGQP